MAALFDLTNNEHLEDNDATDLQVGTGSFTLMTWAKWTEGAVDMVLIGKGVTPAGTRYHLRVISSSDSVQAAVDDDTGIGAVTVLSTTSGMNNGALRHFAMVVNKSDNTLKIYVNGIEEDSADITGLTTLDNAEDFTIARQAGNPNLSFSGTQDDARLYLRALTSAEILTISTLRGHDEVLGDLEARWTMFERGVGEEILDGPPSPVLDLSGNGNDLVGHGDTTFHPKYAQSELTFQKRFMRA